MDGPTILIGLAGVLATAAPIVVASIGESLAERSGVINLSVNGTILLSAMGGFAVAVTTSSIVLGFIAGAFIGAVVALLVAFGSITLRRSQVAVGFVLTLFCRDLAYFLGNPFMGEKGPRLAEHGIPLLQDIPILGTLIFKHDVMTYFSFVLIIVAWWWVYRTRPGLMLRAVGERPAAAFARGAKVNLVRYTYTVVGGALVGLAGPMYSLSMKAGWKGTISGLDGLGWIVLAIVIFGAWNPVRVAFGAYLFGLLQWLSVVLQPSLHGIPSQVLQVAPFPLMILTLLFVNVGNAEWVDRILASLPEVSRKRVAKILRSLRVVQPRSLGVPFEPD
jgi:simple sugar transport system permease protein